MSMAVAVNDRGDRVEEREALGARGFADAGGERSRGQRPVATIVRAGCGERIDPFAHDLEVRQRLQLALHRGAERVAGRPAIAEPAGTRATPPARMTSESSRRIS
jgi:hypothetical protein